MSKPLDARTAALRILESVDKGMHVDRAARKWLANVADVRDRGLANEISYGVLRWRSRLDFEITPKLRGKTEPILLNILRLTLFQIRRLDRVPAHAAVNAAVDLASSEGHAHAKGMVNAIARRFLRDGEPKWPNDDSVASLALEFAHPEWLVATWLRELGLETTRALLAADQERPAAVVRVRDSSVESALKILHERGVEAVQGRFASGSIQIREGGDPQGWDEIKSGAWVLQDEGAQAIISLLPPAGEHLDVCAAPGGKAFWLADRDKTAKIFAIERDATRIADMVVMRNRLGLSERVETVHADATSPVLGGRLFSSVLVDAPCSGLGTLRRNPDRKWRQQPDPDLPRLQSAILEQASKQTEIGGHLLYVTCTLWKAENERVAEAFEARHAGYERVKTEHPLADADGFYRSWPHLHGTDGFFGALWRRLR